jgi:hypothetical protein
MTTSPDRQADEKRQQVESLFCEEVLVARWMVLVEGTFEEPMIHQIRKASCECCRWDSKKLLEVAELTPA